MTVTSRDRGQTTLDKGLLLFDYFPELSFLQLDSGTWVPCYDGSSQPMAACHNDENKA